MSAPSTDRFAAGKSLPFDHPLHLQAHRFLVDEAWLLDQRDYETWLTLLTEDVVYQVPVTMTTDRLDAPVAGQMDHYFEDYFSLQMRVRRLKTKFAWAEDPPSRTRHLITNVATYATEQANEIHVRSYILLVRSRGDLSATDMIPGLRQDVLRLNDGGLRLARRQVTLDEAVLRTQNLTLFL
jgi:phthalate 3,4-dioxygenase beta subunit